MDHLFRLIEACSQLGGSFATERAITEKADAFQRINSRNLLSSHFYGLPTEILLMIVSYLNPATHLAFRCTCRRFRELVRPFSGTNIPTSEINEWRVVIDRIRHEIFPSSCKVERHAKRIKENALCSFCSRGHPTTYFSKAQLRLPPEKRECRGSRRRVRVCSHLSLSYAQLKWMESQVIWFSCQQHDPQTQSCSRSPWAFVERNFNLPYWPYSRFSYFLRQRILEVPRDEEVTQTMLLSALRHLKVPICPHITISDYEIKAFASYIECLNHACEDTQNAYNTTLHRSCPKCGKFRQCPIVCCRTEFRLVRMQVKSMDMDQIYLYVSRQFSNVEHINDRWWLAISESPKVDKPYHQQFFGLGEVLRRGRTSSRQLHQREGAWGPDWPHMHFSRHAKWGELPIPQDSVPLITRETKDMAPAPDVDCLMR